MSPECRFDGSASLVVKETALHPMYANSCTVGSRSAYPDVQLVRLGLRGV
jgi:hypothetical protein